jgi:CRISPR-associated endonuclease/helicase Cas3
MTYYARSATPHAPNQPYPEHVANVSGNADWFLVRALRYWRGEAVAESLAGTMRTAAVFHDLGKLDEDNQKVLRGRNPRTPLPVPHQDAGVAHLLAQNDILSALLVYAHHIGLPDMKEVQEQTPPLRNPCAEERAVVDRSLPELMRRHAESGIGLLPDTPPLASPLLATDSRILFSCLTDADHGDASRASGKIPQSTVPPELPLRSADRLEALRRHVAALPPASTPAEQTRNKLRSAFFNACLESPVNAPLTECDAPVGTGKTTAVMAHLLRTVQKHGLRRIFVILPFTNIIRQSVEVYRKALVLPGENPDEIVAEIHHRADFADLESRQLTALWHAPVVVTTAVAFFETLASNHPSTIRRLHNLPGSAVFLDEAHAMLPARLLPLAWHWIKHTARNWSCFWTLASGSLSRFWEISEFKDIAPASAVPVNILPEGKRSQLAVAETARVTYRHKREALTLEALTEWLDMLEGPVLVVLNTVHTAAAAARMAKSKFGGGNVLHLSTALSPKDRETTLDLVKARLRHKGHTKWFLFATSCVEAGVDFSFRTGVRECASLSSLLQLAGRINRSAAFPDADVWTITLDAVDPDVVSNPAWTVASRILSEFLEAGRSISPELCTCAMTRELRERNVWLELQKLQEAEDTCAFRSVANGFHVIVNDTAPVVVDAALIERIRRFDNSITWRDIQNGSVQIRRHIRERTAVEESSRYPGVFLWNNDYSPFLGYMEGVLKLADIDKDNCAII